MDLHIVGGFLGSGKTTAIIGAARTLMAQGKRVGVVTNDQGRYLVDTAFFRSAAVPTVEVTGGCFCCNYEDLETVLAQLRETARPDVIFAESVGSCADIVATVVKPLLTLRQPDMAIPSSFSVFADARLLRRRLTGMPMPFSEDLVYLFDKQLEEAGMVVVNKQDLLTEPQAQELAAVAAVRFPDKPVRLQNSLDAAQVEAWIAALESGLATPPAASLNIAYERYGAGEAALAWLDEKLIFTVSEGKGKEVVCRFIEALVTRLQYRNLAIGHLKFLVRGGTVEGKVSLPSLGTENWQAYVPELVDQTVTVLVNARVEAVAAELHALVHEAVDVTREELGATYQVLDVDYFHPALPNPSHRMA